MRLVEDASIQAEMNLVTALELAILVIAHAKHQELGMVKDCDAQGFSYKERIDRVDCDGDCNGIGGGWGDGDACANTMRNGTSKCERVGIVTQQESGEGMDNSA